MNSQELGNFLAKPILMNLATVTPDGYPHVVPVWFEHNEGTGEFLVSVDQKSKKFRNLSKSPTAGFSIAENQLPYPAVVGYGNVTITADPENELLKRLTRKYLPPEKADNYCQELINTRYSSVTLTIKPSWILSWTGE